MNVWRMSLNVGAHTKGTEALGLSMSYTVAVVLCGGEGCVCVSL